MAFFMAYAALDCIVEILYSELPVVYWDVAQKKATDKSIQDTYKEKFILYSNVRRSLIDEKLHDVISESITMGCDKINKVFESLQGYDKTRNEIAHCDADYKIDSYLDLITSILQLICLIKYQKPMEDFVTITS